MPVLVVGGGGRRGEAAAVVFQDVIFAFGKAHMRSIPSFGCFPNVVLKTVSMFAWLKIALCSPFKEDRLAFPLSTPSPPGDLRCDVLGIVPTNSVSSSSILPSFRDASHLWWLLFPASLSAQSFPFSSKSPGQYIHRGFPRWMWTIDTCGRILRELRLLTTLAKTPYGWDHFMCSCSPTTYIIWRKYMYNYHINKTFWIWDI